MIKQYFKENCISIRQWIKKHNLNQQTTYMVINGQLTGERNTNGNTRAVFEALLSEGIIDKLPSGLREAKAS